MRKISVTIDNLRLLDSETAKVYNRIATLMHNKEESTVNVFTENSIELDLSILTQRIFDLERENAILRFRNQNKDFDLDTTITNFKSNIERRISTGELKAHRLPQMYGYSFFSGSLHPDYVYSIAQFLIDLCSSEGLEVDAEIWHDLLLTTGVLTPLIIEKYEVSEDVVDSNLI